MKKVNEFIKLLLKTNCLNYVTDEFIKEWIKIEAKIYNYLYENDGERLSDYYDLVDEFDRKLQNSSTNLLFNFCLDMRNSMLYDCVASDREAVAFVLTYKTFMKDKYFKQINKLIKDAYQVYNKYGEKSVYMIYGLEQEIKEEEIKEEEIKEEEIKEELIESYATEEELNPDFYDWDYEPTDEELYGEPIDCEEF